MGFNPLDRAKDAGVKRMMSQMTPSEEPLAQVGVNALVNVEHRQAEAIARAVDVADLPVNHGHNAAQRRETLLEILDAVFEQGFDDWWWETVAPEVLDEPEQARKYVGIDADEWTETIENWYRGYHEAGIVDEPVDEVDRTRIGDVADSHCQSKFGVSLQDFAEIVVNWSRGQHARRILTGPIMQHTRIIYELSDVVEQKNERIEELEYQLQEARERK